MQASKVKPGHTYAITNEGVLRRFRVTAVVTNTRRTKERSSPHDHRSHVEGIILSDAFPPESTDGGKVISVSPERLLGPYEEHAELVARDKAVKAQREAEDKRVHKAALALQDLLYQATGSFKPTDSRDYKQPFRVSYGGSNVEITQEGVQVLTTFLKSCHFYVTSTKV